MDRTSEFLALCGAPATIARVPVVHYRNVFHQAAVGVQLSIAGMLEFLLSQREAYILHTTALFSGAVTMSDIQRAQLDEEIDKFAKSCSNNIEALKNRIGVVEASKDTYVHQHTVILSLYGALASLSETMSKMRTTRMTLLKENRARQAATGGSTSAVAAEMLATLSESDDDEDLLPADQKQRYEDENAQLFENLQDKLDDVHRAEKSLVEISQIMTLFSAKVTEQEELIHNIYENSVNAYAHLSSGQEELKTALERGASYRVNMLFFFLVASLSLLFLDWYN